MRRSDWLVPCGWKYRSVEEQSFRGGAVLPQRRRFWKDHAENRPDGLCKAYNDSCAGNKLDLKTFSDCPLLPGGMESK